MLDLDDLSPADPQANREKARRVLLHDRGVDPDLACYGIGEGERRPDLLRHRIPRAVGKLEHDVVLAEADRGGDRCKRGVVLHIGCAILIADPLETGAAAARAVPAGGVPRSAVSASGARSRGPLRRKRWGGTEDPGTGP